MRIEPTNAALGADIIDVDLSKALSKNEFTFIIDAWNEYSVLRFRKQNLDDKHLVNFSKLFGPLDMAPTGRGGTPFDPTQQPTPSNEGARFTMSDMSRAPATAI